MLNRRQRQMCIRDRNSTGDVLSTALDGDELPERTIAIEGVLEGLGRKIKELPGSTRCRQAHMTDMITDVELVVDHPSRRCKPDSGHDPFPKPEHAVGGRIHLAQQTIELGHVVEHEYGSHGGRQPGILFGGPHEGFGVAHVLCMVDLAMSLGGVAHESTSCPGG